MLVSQEWLKEYVELPEHDELVDRLTMSGLNHEGTQQVGDDLSIDLEVTSNRSDCLGHIGVAREIATLFENPLSIPDPQPVANGPAVSDEFQVEIQSPDLCYRFTARLIRNVKIGPSPDWLVKRLQSAIVKRKKDGSLEPYQSVNNVVDISNYVMLECGQPLHTFDYDKLEGGKIVVREPNEGEQLLAIDHSTYDLRPGMCVIADGVKGVGLAGVMGGADTEVSDQTTNILVEAAYFNPMAVRSTARHLKLFSAASFRFERTINSENLDWASRRCCELILDLAGGELAAGMIDVGQPPEPRQPITLRHAQLERILGIAIPADDAVAILKQLGFQVSENTPQAVTVVPPAWRRDCDREVDLIEEVGRIYGYDKVPDNVAVPMAASVRSHEDRTANKIRRAMTAAGFDESMTASMVPSAWSDSFSPWCDHAPLQSHQAMLGVLDSSWQNMPVNLLRRSLLPSLLEAFRINEFKQNQDIDLFETAKVYLPQGADQLPAEPWKLALITERGYRETKGVIESLIGLLNQRAILKSQLCDLPLLDLTESAKLMIDDQCLGWIGQASESAKSLFRIKRNCTIAELDIALLNQLADPIIIHQSISQFPSITRDFNFVLDESVAWDDLADSVRQAAGPLLESITYKETFRNTEKDGANKKRVLLSIVLRSVESTLTGEQAESTCQNIINACQENNQAVLLG